MYNYKLRFVTQKNAFRKTIENRINKIYKN